MRISSQLYIHRLEYVGYTYVPTHSLTDCERKLKFDFLVHAISRVSYLVDMFHVVSFQFSWIRYMNSCWYSDDVHTHQTYDPYRNIFGLLKKSELRSCVARNRILNRTQWWWFQIKRKKKKNEIFLSSPIFGIWASITGRYHVEVLWLS